MKIPAFSLKLQTEKLKKELLKATGRVVESGQFVLGQEVEDFEINISRYLDVPYAIGVSSGTDALWLALKAAGVGSGDKVLTTPFTFFATASAILKTGAQPVFADIDPKTYNLDPKNVLQVLEGKCATTKRLGISTQSIKAIIPVHLYGQTVEMDALGDVAKSKKLVVIEDACQSFGSVYQNKKAGGLADLGCFSFFPTKNLGALGDAGMVVTRNRVFAERVRSLRAHGSQQKYHHETIGSNCRIDALQAALLNTKLAYLDDWLYARRKHAAQYDELLQNLSGVVIPQKNSDEQHTYHQYTLRIAGGHRDRLKEYLETKSIGSTIYYPIPLHLQSALQHLGYKEGDFLFSEVAASEVLSLPMYPELKESEIKQVAEAVIGYITSQAKDANACR